MKTIRLRIWPVASAALPFALTTFILSALLAQPANAQITPARMLSTVPSKRATLTEYLINRLRATTDDQKAYVREVVALINKGRLEMRFVLALQRRAREKSPHFPLPVFERTLKAEAGKKGIPVPTLREIVARNGVSAARAISDSRFRR